MLHIVARVVRRFTALSKIRVVVDVPRTLAARKKYPLFTELVVGRFDQMVAMYRIFDQNELKHILATGKITGGQYSVKAEREHGASWGSNITEVIRWGNGQRGGRLGKDLYLAKLDAFDKYFAHLDPEVEFDINGADEQDVLMDPSRCYTGVGCSVIDVGVDDVTFFKVDERDQLHRMSLSELKADIKDGPAAEEEAEAAPEVPEEIRDPEWGLQPKDKLIVTKGSTGLGVGIRSTATVLDVWQRKGEREVRVKLFFPFPRKFPNHKWTRDNLVLYAAHANRLKDREVTLMNSKGDKIYVRKK